MRSLRRLEVEGPLHSLNAYNLLWICFSLLTIAQNVTLESYMHIDYTDVADDVPERGITSTSHYPYYMPSISIQFSRQISEA
jgi:hypothetical protein